MTLSTFYVNIIGMTGLEDAWQIHSPSTEHSISFHGYANDEMLRITKDAFYVRGKPVPINEHEAETVYNAFQAWLTWANMQRR